MLITDLLSRNADAYGDDVSLVEINPELQEKHENSWREYELIEPNPALSFRREMTWREFDDRANRFANLLLSRGIKQGDKVAILLMNSLEWLPIYFGILKSGAVAVPLNFRYAAEEIDYCLKLSESLALVFGPEFTERLESISDKLTNIACLYVGEDGPAFAENYAQLEAVCSCLVPQIQVKPQDDAAIYFSSGTTGFPKAILHDHRSLLSACYTEQNHHLQTREDNFLCIPPLYHTGAKMHWFGSLLAGSKAVLLRGVKPQWILKAVAEEKATIVWLLVPWAGDILRAIESGEIKLDDYELAQWRLMHVGAQPVPPSLIHRWQSYFPSQLYDTNYGLSESIGPGCVHLGIENIHKVGAIGKAGFGWKVNIVDEAGDAVPQGSVGELIVQGPGVMQCYYNDPEATAAVLKNGWLFTGDMARMDEDGFIYLVDRKKDVIISGGENLYPVQIEDFLHKCSAVKDVAVIGLPDPRLGEIAAAIIELKSDVACSQEEIMEFCLALPRYKRPRKIIFDVVPRNPTGKIEKPKLRKKYCVENLIADQTQN